MSENRFKKFLEQLKDPNSAASAAVENASFTGLTVAGTGLGLLKFFDYAQSKQLKYSDVLRLFREGKVSAYHLDMSSRNLVFQRKDSGAYGSAIVPDTQLFLKDIHKLVKQHNDENPDDPIAMDYSRGIPNWVYFALIGGIATLLVLDNALWNMSQNQQQIQIRQDQGRQQFTKSKFSLQSHRTATFDDVAGADQLVEHFFVECGVYEEVGPSTEAPVHHARLTCGVGSLEDVVEFYELKHAGEVHIDYFVTDKGIVCAMTEDVFSNTLQVTFSITSQRDVCPHDVCLRRHANVAAVKSAASHRAHDVAAMVLAVAISAVAGCQHLGRRSVDHAEPVVSGIGSHRVPEPLDA